MQSGQSRAPQHFTQLVELSVNFSRVLLVARLVGCRRQCKQLELVNVAGRLWAKVSFTCCEGRIDCSALAGLVKVVTSLGQISGQACFTARDVPDGPQRLSEAQVFQCDCET